MSNDLIRARLVYDGGNTVHIPPELGTPRADQMQGTPAEQLCELAGRACYDSLGKGRPSFTRTNPPLQVDEGGLEKPDVIQGYHDHILEVGHGSVLEHFNFTISHNSESTSGGYVALTLLNRPGVFAIYDHGDMRITCNLRAVREWISMSMNGQDITATLGTKLWGHARKLAPNIFSDQPSWLTNWASDGFYVDACPAKYDEECWISMFMSGSRGLSHELVRHGDFTAISQRSTRFVDESESDWVEHPLTTQYMVEHKYGNPPGRYFNPEAAAEAKVAYRQTVNSLEPWLLSRGIDKTSARKQARGAARGYLGNALYTELIFSANVTQWKRMLRQRASRFADAEIRELFCKALVELKRSRYGDRFDGFDLQDSPDGIGQVAVEK